MVECRMRWSKCRAEGAREREREEGRREPRNRHPSACGEEAAADCLPAACRRQPQPSYTLTIIPISACVLLQNENAILYQASHLCSMMSKDWSATTRTLVP